VEVGGARIDPARLRDFEAVTGARTTRWFGMAEGPLSFTRPHDPDGPRLSGEGFPLSLDDEYLVVDAAGRPCAPGESGELLVRGPTTLRGYYREPDHNKLAFTTDGFLRTGDLADLDAEGNLTIRDRITDVVNRGGEKVPSGLVESLLVRHPAVRACAVAGVPDAVLTEKVAAFVVPDGAPPVLADLVEHLIGHGLAPHCVPEHLVLLDALPMTQLGKVDKKALVAAHA
jgi:2,3-dihydroxybenzoate-AMP ligase